LTVVKNIHDERIWSHCISHDATANKIPIYTTAMTTVREQQGHQFENSESSARAATRATGATTITVQEQKHTRYVSENVLV
jgi:hypothetical protein